MSCMCSCVACNAATSESVEQMRSFLLACRESEAPATACSSSCSRMVRQSRPKLCGYSLSACSSSSSPSALILWKGEECQERGRRKRMREGGERERAARQGECSSHG
eukprot:534882-Rhodomonas_salina.6